MNFLLEITKNDYSTSIIETKGLTETLLFGAQILLIGLATVFSVLVLLWCLISMFKLFLGTKPKTKKVVATPEAIPVVKASNKAEEEIVAVIAAAIAAAESENKGVKFRVVSFNRK